MTTDDGATTPWYRRPGILAVVALVVLALGVGVGLLLSAGEDDDGDRVGTTGTTTPATTAPTPTATSIPPTTASTTSIAAEVRCGTGDQVACDQLDDDQLQAFCDDGNVDACQVLLARQGDGVPDGPDGESQGNGNGNDEGDDGDGYDD